MGNFSYLQLEPLTQAWEAPHWQAICRMQSLPLPFLLIRCQKLLHYNYWTSNVPQLHPWLHQLTTNQLRSQCGFKIDLTRSLCCLYFKMMYYSWDVGIAVEVYFCGSEICLRTVPSALMLDAAYAVSLTATKSLTLIIGTGKFLFWRLKVTYRRHSVLEHKTTKVCKILQY